jgi:hypothetical protein
MTTEEINKLIAKEYQSLSVLAIQKNNSYNGSIFNPDWIIKPSMELSNKDMIELGLTARINDKINRIKSAGLKGFDEDNLKDLIGYLILFRIAQQLKE